MYGYDYPPPPPLEPPSKGWHDPPLAMPRLQDPDDEEQGDQEDICNDCGHYLMYCECYPDEGTGGY